MGSNLDKNVQDIISNLELENSRLSSIISSANVGTWIWNVQSGEQDINHRWAGILGYTLDEISPISYETFIKYSHPEDYLKATESIDLVLASKSDTYSIEIRMKHKLGHWVWVHSIGKINTWSDDGKPLVISGIHIDISRRKMVEEQRDVQLGLISSLFESIPDPIFVKDKDGTYMNCNPAFSLFVGKSISEIIGLTDYELFEKEIADQFRFQDKQVLDANMTYRFEENKESINGIMKYTDILKAPFVDAKGNLIGLIGIGRDITDRKTREDDILYLSYHDHLTGLYNRRFFEEELKRLDSERNLPFTIVMGDVNGLKLINDYFSHALGDEMLIKAAKIISSVCRADEIVARLGGDEFIILLPNTDSDGARKLINRITVILEEELVNSLPISISFGYDTKNKDFENINMFITNAEDNMYKAKLLDSLEYKKKLIAFIEER